MAIQKTAEFWGSGLGERAAPASPRRSMTATVCLCHRFRPNYIKSRMLFLVAMVC